MMKDELQALVRGSRNALEARNLLREALQANILAGLQRGGAMLTLAFHGGTALRLLFGLPRFSEDLDFSLREPAGYDFPRLLTAVTRDLRALGYEPSVKASDKRAVHSAFVAFPGLLHELGVSGRASESLAVKIEIDTRPPPGATYETTLLAGKLHAVLQRPYVKGRDLYDLAWYLADREWPGPNLQYLNQALAQTGWTGHELTDQSWLGRVRHPLAPAAVSSTPWMRCSATSAPWPSVIGRDRL